MASQMTIDMELRFVDKASGEAKNTSKSFKEIEKTAKSAGEQVDKLADKKASPTIDADSSRADKKLSKIDSVLRKLGARKTKTPLDADDKATAKIQKALNKAREWTGKKFNAFLELKDSAALKSLNNFSSNLKRFAGKTWTTIVKIKDLATAPLRGIKNMLFSIKSLVVAVTAGLAAKQLVMNPIGQADAYSSAKIGFSTLLGESAGQQMMNDLDVFAKKTPFKTSGVIENAQKMMAMGWDTDTLIDDLETLGNAAAATGKLDTGLESIVRAMAQIKTKGRLSTEELNQLAEAGIAAKAMLAENLGYGTGDEGIAAMTEDLEKGAIASNEAIQALMAGMKKYDGMMDSIANETVEGLWSQIQDTFEINVLRKWGQGLQDGAKRGFGTLVELLDDADAALSKLGDLLYDIGKNVSNWVADRFENAVKRISEITDSYDFKNASLGEKISMLWNGVVVDPLKEWWEGGGQEKTAETAGKIGTWMGEMLTKGLLALFGATDILDEGIGQEQGANVAGSFLDGFLGAFDGSAITSAFVDAIGNVWGALPTWAKLLIGGYGIGKAAGGISNFASGVSSFIGGAANVIGSASSMTGILGLGSKTAVALGAGNLAGGASLGAGAMSALGLGGIAGGIAAGASTIKGGYDLYKSYKAYKAGDTTEAKANAASGGTALGGAAAGAAAGAALGSIIPGLGTAIGALIGAGIGGISGWIGGDKWAKTIRENAAEAKFEIEGVGTALENAASEEEKMAILNEAVWENMKRRMGDVKLSAAEISRLAEQIVWGEDLGKFDKFVSATKTAENALQSLKTASEQTDRWMWKASLGVKFNEDEVESIKASVEDYINSAKSYVENKHYEFTAAVSLLVDVESEDGKRIIETGNSFYSKIENEIDALGSELSTAMETALKDGVISSVDKVKIKIGDVEYELNEQDAIAKLQQKIAELTNKIAQAEADAEIELIKIKFGGGNLDLDSFDAFMEQMETTLSGRMETQDQAFKLSVSSLNLQLAEGAITQEEYDRQLKTLTDGYTAEVDSIKADILDVELNIIGDAFKDVLGKDAASKLQTALETGLSHGLHPLEWTPDQVRTLLGIENLSDDTALAISQMLAGVADQLQLLEGESTVEVNPEAVVDPVLKIAEGLQEKIDTIIREGIPYETVAGTTILLEPSLKYQPFMDDVGTMLEGFGMESQYTRTVSFLLTADAEALNQLDPSNLAASLGVPDAIAEDILMKLSATKSIDERLDVLASDFGVPDSISKTISVNLTAIKGKVTSLIGNLFGGDQYRGGIVGGSSSLEAFARGGIAGYSEGGMVRGGAQLITVAEEGSPEMIIPLSSQRRDRALQLWAKAGEMLGVTRGFARGGRTDGGTDEGIRFMRYGSDEPAGGQSVHVEVGGVQVTFQVNAGSENIVEAIKEQAGEISELVAGILADAIGGQFENTPVRGGA